MLAIDEVTYYIEGGTKKLGRWDIGIGVVLGGPTLDLNLSLD